MAKKVVNKATGKQAGAKDAVNPAAKKPEPTNKAAKKVEQADEATEPLTKAQDTTEAGLVDEEKQAPEETPLAEGKQAEVLAITVQANATAVAE